MATAVATPLTVRNLRVTYGRVVAVRGVSFDVPAGSSVGIIGANGAGKSSTLKAIFRLVNSTADAVTYGGTSLRSTAPHKIVSLGIGYVPEGRRVFAGLTVHKNLLMGAYREPWRRMSGRVDHVYEIFPALKPFGSTLAGALSGGQQQMLAIGRALMSSPTLLVLDEPSMGLAPVLIEDIAAALRRLRVEGVSLLLVEQNAKLTFGLTDRCVVLENGEIVKEGTSAELRQDTDVRRIYLGI
ncbi:MAG: ABC transporter ATP-binding protein [Candidatus Dormibacteraceae bacterium]